MLKHADVICTPNTQSTAQARVCLIGVMSCPLITTLCAVQEAYVPGAKGGDVEDAKIKKQKTQASEEKFEKRETTEAPKESAGDVMNIGFGLGLIDSAIQVPSAHSVRFSSVSPLPST